MAPGYVGPVCTADCNQGLQDRVHGEPPKNKGAPLHPDSSESGATSGPRTRPGVHARETGDQGDSLPHGHPGVLLPYLSGGQGVGRLAPDPQFKGVQQICKAPILLDGDATNSDGLPGRGPPAEAKDLRAFEGLLNVRDVGSLYRFKRCLLSRPRSTRTHTVPPLCLQWQGVRIPGSPVRALNSTSGVHEDCASHRGVPQDTGCRHAPVSRRLASEEPVKVACGTSTRPHTVLGDKTGLPSKRRKVSVDTHTVPSIPGIDPRPHQHARFPEREEGCQSVATGILALSTESTASENLAEALRTSVQSARVSPHGGDAYSSDPTYAPQSVDASFGQPISPDIPRSAQGAGVVGITGQPDGGPAFSQARSDYDDSHRCLHGGLGRSPRRLGDLRSVVAGLGQAPHQLARTAGSMADSAAFSASGTGHCCGCPYGQLHYGGLHQQGGWNSVPHLVLPGTGPVGLVQATRDLPVDMHQYLDDWLLKNQSRSLVERQRHLTLFWVTKLGFLVNEGKSQLIPTQFPAFLGSTLDLINMLVFPSEKRVVRASRLASSLLARSPQPAKTWQKLLGHLSSLRELVPMAVTHTRLIQLMLHSQWTQVSDSPYLRIYPD